MKLKDKVAIVTGGNKGIGRAISLNLAEEGADVVVAARDMQAANEVVEKIKGMQRESFSVKTDVRQVDQVNAMVKRVIDEFGRIDILVNNAGILLMTPAVDITEKEWDEIMRVNARGVFLCCRAVAKHMIEQKQGKIINISSVAGKRGSPLMAHYCASKFAVLGLTFTLALELSPYNINVNAVCPGDIDTDMLKQEWEWFGKIQNMSSQEVEENKLSGIPFRRVGKPEDIAKLVTFLASPEADYITGQAINVDGGMENH